MVPELSPPPDRLPACPLPQLPFPGEHQACSSLGPASSCGLLAQMVTGQASSEPSSQAHMPPLTCCISFLKVKVKSLSRVRLFATPWTTAYQAPLSMGLCRQEYWSGLPFPSPGNLPDPGIKPGSPTLQAEALPSALSGKSISFLELSNIQNDLVPSFAYAAVDCLQGLSVTQLVNVQGTERQMEVPKEPPPCLLSLPLNLWPCPVLPTPVAGQPVLRLHWKDRGWRKRKRDTEQAQGLLCWSSG